MPKTAVQMHEAKKAKPGSCRPGQRSVPPTIMSVKGTPTNSSRQSTTLSSSSTSLSRSDSPAGPVATTSSSCLSGGGNLHLRGCHQNEKLTPAEVDLRFCVCHTRFVTIGPLILESSNQTNAGIV